MANSTAIARSSRTSLIVLSVLSARCMAQSVTDLIEQGAPAFDAAIPTLSQLLQAELAEREVRCIAYHMKSARFPAYKDLSGFDFAASEFNEATVRTLHRCELMDGAQNVCADRWAGHWPDPCRDGPRRPPARSSSPPAATATARPAGRDPRGRRHRHRDRRRSLRHPPLPHRDHPEPQKRSAVERRLRSRDRPEQNPARHPTLWQRVLETMDRIPCPKPNRGEDAVPQGFRRRHPARDPDRQTAEIQIRIALMNRFAALVTAQREPQPA